MGAFARAPRQGWGVSVLSAAAGCLFLLLFFTAVVNLEQGRECSKAAGSTTGGGGGGGGLRAAHLDQPQGSSGSAAACECPQTDAAAATGCPSSPACSKLPVAAAAAPQALASAGAPLVHVRLLTGCDPPCIQLSALVSKCSVMLRFLIELPPPTPTHLPARGGLFWGLAPLPTSACRRLRRRSPAVRRGTRAAPVAAPALPAAARAGPRPLLLRRPRPHAPFRA